MGFLFFGNQPIAGFVPLAVAITGLFSLLRNPRGLTFFVSEMNSQGASEIRKWVMSTHSHLTFHLICSIGEFKKFIKQQVVLCQKGLGSTWAGPNKKAMILSCV